MRRLVLIATVVVLINALRQHPRHITETQLSFPDGIDPAPDKVSGEANRLKAQEPLEGDPVKNFGRDVITTTPRSISYTAKETSTKGSVVVSPVTHVVFVKNPPLNPPRGQVIKKMLTVRSMPTPPPTTTVQTTTVAQPTTSLPESSVQGSDNSAESFDPGSEEIADDTDAEASEEGTEEENSNNEEESHTKEGQTRATATPHLVHSTSPLPPASESVTISTDPLVKPTQEPKPEFKKGTARKTSVEHTNAQQGKDGASWKRVEQRPEYRGNKEVQSGSASEDKIGDEKGVDAAHKPSMEVQSNYEGFENQEEEKSEQNSKKSLATVSKTKIEATEEQRDEESNKTVNNPEGTVSISESKMVAVKKEQVGHNVEQEGANKPVGESEEGALNDASTESYDEEGEGEDYEPDESGQSSERTDPLPNKNITEEELEQPMDAAELAELGNSTSAEQEAEEEYEPKGSGIVLEGTNSVNLTKKNEDKQKKPSAEAERRDEKHIWKEPVLSSNEKEANHAASLSPIRGNPGEWHKKMIRTAEGPKPSAAERITDKNKEHGAAGNDRKKSAISAEEDETSGSEEQVFESAEGTQNRPHGADDAHGTQVENAAEADHGSSTKENRIEKMNDHDVPVVEVDSRTKGRDIVIAYNPTYRKGSGVVRADFVEPSSAKSSRNGATPGRTVAKEIMERIVRPKTSTIILKEPRRPFKLDCTTEEDQKGASCEIWAQSGLCQAHRPTMFLFCRKTCLCGGEPALD
uniref:ShKT domain-containing protein n=1 Tax=Haemonchus contortus TaxID=6289 RepID=A0A7I4Y006_HAECO